MIIDYDGFKCIYSDEVICYRSMCLGCRFYEDEVKPKLNKPVQTSGPTQLCMFEEMKSCRKRKNKKK